jgi:predicted O-methyltransferase YrrM
MIEKLAALEQASRERKIPIIGKVRGRWLSQKVKELQPKTILEFGTANGYSGCILGSAGAELTTIEINEKMAEEAMVNFGRFAINAKVIIGDGLKLAAELVSDQVKYDLIFLDFQKSGYLPVLEHCLKLLNPGGYLIADNITFAKCQDFKHAVLNHPQLETEIISLGDDGLSCSKKL